MPSARRAAMKARTSAGVSVGRALAAMARRPDARRGSQGTARRRARRPPASSATCAARRRDSRASARFRRPRRGRCTAFRFRLMCSAAKAATQILASFTLRVNTSGLFPLPKPRNRPESHMPRRVVDVLVPVALDQAYSYRVPEALALEPGDLVAVPLGAREATGRGLGGQPESQSAPAQPAEGRRRESSTCRRCKPELRSFVDWVSDYTLARAAWCCAWRCAWASISGPRASASACGSPARRRSA